MYLHGMSAARAAFLCWQGADFVEFDVQLSRDLVPVVYHDFIVGLTLKKVGMDTRDYILD